MRRTRGAITIVVLLLLGSLAALATGVVIAGSGNLNASFQGVESEKALWAAQAGSSLALVRLKDDTNWAGFGGLQSIPNSDLQFNATTYRHPQLTPKGAAIPTGMVYIQTIGQTHTGKTREMGVLVSTSFGALSYPILAKDSLKVIKATVDVRDPATNLVLPGSADVAVSGSSGTIDMTDCTVNGNYDIPVLHPNLPPDPTRIVTGIRRPAPSLTYPDVTLPAGADPESASDASFSGPGPHPPLPPGVYKKLEIDNGAELEFTAGDYTIKELIVKNGSILRYRNLTQRVNLFVTGTVLMEDYNIVNDSRIPRNFRILADEALAPDVNLIGTTTGYFLCYAPNSKVKLDNGSQVYGAVVGKEIEVNNNSQVHYDPASAGSLDMGSGSSVTGVQIVSHQFF